MLRPKTPPRFGQTQTTAAFITLEDPQQAKVVIEQMNGTHLPWVGPGVLTVFYVVVHGRICVFVLWKHVCLLCVLRVCLPLMILLGLYSSYESYES